MAHAEASGRDRWSGYLLGFAFGGFFDGILLHQILQWHHLLSAINGQDIRFQVAADGYFHAFMYVIAAVGLWRLWASRNAPDRPSGRHLLANILIGFGVWHIIDSVASHWVLGIHRIRMDSGDPLFWDLLWFGAFGILPLAIGWLMRRAGDDDGMRVTRSPAVTRSLVAMFVIGAGTRPCDRRRTARSRRCCSHLEQPKSRSSVPSAQSMDGWFGLTGLESLWLSASRTSSPV